MKNLNKRIYHKLDSFLIPIMKKYRIEKLNNTDFTIICNNCWGGYVYRRYGLPYLSPTIGLYLFAEDFLKFCNNLEHYAKTPITFINYEDSKWRDILKERNQTEIPIGIIDDIEIIFLHYKTRKEALEKWTRRCQRINYNNLIFKFSKMNLCGNEELDQFDNIDANKKICFVPKNYLIKRKSFVVFKSEKGLDIIDDTSEYSRYINLTKMINAKYVNGRNMR